MLKTTRTVSRTPDAAYHLGEGRVLKTLVDGFCKVSAAYHLGEGRVLKTEGGEG